MCFLRKTTGCWIASAAFALDRVTKWLVLSELRGKAPADVLPGILRLVYVENRGAAWGLFGGHTIPLGWLTAVIVIGLIVFLICKGSGLPTFARDALWLLAGGAAGNSADRLFFGYVVDFLEFRFFSFPVFNVADCCISVSAVLLTGFILFHGEARPNAR